MQLARNAVSKALKRKGVSPNVERVDTQLSQRDKRLSKSPDLYKPTMWNSGLTDLVSRE